VTNPTKTYTNPGITTVSIGTSGTYYITADGAEGGAGLDEGPQSLYYAAGGAGAAVGGDVYLQAGTLLEIVVASQGGSTYQYGGGGGGSFVIEAQTPEAGTVATILAVAGGGGGGGNYALRGSDGRAVPTGGTGAGGGPGYGGEGGRDGAPGQNGRDGGGGGGGYTGGNSGNNGSPGTVVGSTFYGGTDPTGGHGGSLGFGGFGGGGAGGYGGGGGGGGYGGGGGAQGSDSGGGGGGGGGSYLDTALVSHGVETAGVNSGNVNNGNGEVTITIVCYVAGTRILTDRGEVAVENLRVGDALVTAAGAHRPVRWLGSRRVDCVRHPRPRAVWPIRIQAGAFADGVPTRDLWVSPGHAIFVERVEADGVEGVLIQAEQLVNGATIVQVPLASVEYWHVELDSHDLLLAEGLAAESYLDTGNRAAFFKNGGAYLQAHPDFAAKHWAETCVPLVLEGERLEQARSALLARAVELGCLTQDPDLHALVDGQRIDAVSLNARRLALLLPQGGSSIELRSRSFVPAEVEPECQDRRTLGIRVFNLQIDGEAVGLDDAAVWPAGSHPLERGANGQCWRWTRERLALPPGTRLVVLDTCPQPPVYGMQPADASITRLQGVVR